MRPRSLDAVSGLGLPYRLQDVDGVADHIGGADHDPLMFAKIAVALPRVKIGRSVECSGYLRGMGM
jgi:hypothetical protein